MAGVFSFVFLGEVLEPLQILGGVLALAAIVLLHLRQEHDEKAPAVIRMKQKNQVG
jgi:drug/metabolite transporter (DMT)-like permease